MGKTNICKNIKSKYERIHINKDELIKLINDGKTLKEMSIIFSCGEDKVRSVMREDAKIHKLFCKKRNLKYKEIVFQPCCICGFKGETHKLNGSFYCKKHYNQVYRYGKSIEKTIYDPNDFIIEGDITKIVLRGKNNEIKSYCLIDTEDLAKIEKYKWYESYGYCVTKGVDKNNGIDISNVIFNDYKSMFDHQNHDRLDNRKINLRVSTPHQNAMNMGKKITNSSGVTGVQKQNKKSSKWISDITYNYKNIWLGVYENFDDAVEARLKGEVKYFGVYSPNYSLLKNRLCLEYFSKTDFKYHYIEIDLNGKIILKKILE